MARKLTESEREYARQRKNLIARIRYQAKKEKLSPEQTKDIVSELAGESVTVLTNKGATLEPLEEFYFGAQTILNKIEEYQTPSYENEYNYTYDNTQYYEDWRNYDNEDTDTYEEVAQDIYEKKFNDWYTYTDDGYTSKLTGENYDTRYDALEALREFDIEEAIDEGEIILSRMENYITDIIYSKGWDTGISQLGIDEVKDMILRNVARNRTTLLVKLSQTDENVIALLEKALKYGKGDTQDKALQALSEILELNEFEIKAINDFINETVTDTSFLYKGDSDDSI